MRKSKMIKALSCAVSACALALGLAACGGSSTESTSAGPTFIYLTNNPIGVNKFLESGKAGIEAAAEKFHGTAKIYEGQDETSMRQNLEAAVHESPDVIVTITYDFTDMTKEFAEANPDQKFILIDDCPTTDVPKNMHCAVFREHEAAYLIGYEAGLLTETNMIGSVGAVDNPFIHRYTDAFAEGAKAANPSVKDHQLFIGGNAPFSDPARGKEQGAALAAAGVDHIYAVGVGSNGGIFEAAAAKGVTAYGVDVNQCPYQPGTVGDGTLKLMDTLIPDLIGKVMDGEAESSTSYGLAEGGMDLVSLSAQAEGSQCTVVGNNDVLEQVKQVKQDIIDGKIHPTDPTGVN